MFRTLGLALCLHMALAASAHALDCNAQNLDQTSMNQCAADAYHKVDALLNARYKKIVGCLKDQAAGLVEAQRAWIRFRDAECKFKGSASEGGSIQPTIVGDCLAGVTEARAKALNYYLTCEEGDASCPTVACGFRGAGK